MLSRVSKLGFQNLVFKTWRYLGRHAGRRRYRRQRGDGHHFLRGHRRLRGRRSLRSLESDWNRSPQDLKPPLARQPQ